MTEYNCNPCDGTGVCDICYGSGTVKVAPPLDNTERACTHCGGTGVCNYCSGAGMYDGKGFTRTGSLEFEKGNEPARFRESMRLGRLPK